LNGGLEERLSILDYFGLERESFLMQNLFRPEEDFSLNVEMNVKNKKRLLL
jgi:hypothetical protein